MKGQYKSEIIQRIKDFKKGEREIKTYHENVREKMKKQAQEFIDHISTILKEALQESERDERKNIEEISRHTAEAERFEQNLDQLIDKFETLTESSHPADLILCRKQNPDTFKQLKLPDKLNIVMPSFTVCQINKSENEHQFGKFMSSKVNHIKSLDESSQPILRTWSARRKTSTKRVLESSVKISETKTQKRALYHVSCRDDGSAYISGEGPGIQLIDRSGTELDNIRTDTEPDCLAVMQDRSLIYSLDSNKAIYRVSLNKQKTKFIKTEYGPRGLCCTRSGDILVSMFDFNTSRVVKYSSGWRKIQEFKTDQNGEILFSDPWFICENVNKNICITDLCINSRVVALNKSGNLRFTYHGKILTRTFKDRFDPRCLATDSLGHILVADIDNNAVHLISQDGNFLSFILTEDDGISLPWEISVDTSDNLWLVEHACVKVYQYLS